MLFSVLICLLLLQIKHLVIDFKFQTRDQVKGKAIYGDINGITHSMQQGIGTFLCLLPFIGFTSIILPVLAIADMIIHYHVDWMKMNWGNRDMMNDKFWWHLGLDQFAHQVTYIGIIAIAFL